MFTAGWHPDQLMSITGAWLGGYRGHSRYTSHRGQLFLASGQPGTHERLHAAVSPQRPQSCPHFMWSSMCAHAYTYCMMGMPPSTSGSPNWTHGLSLPFTPWRCWPALQPVYYLNVYLARQGGVITVKRSRLSRANVDKLTFIKMNQAWIPQDMAVPCAE